MPTTPPSPTRPPLSVADALVATQVVKTYGPLGPGDVALTLGVTVTMVVTGG